jgi:outer membrane lipoprotein SlyB
MSTMHFTRIALLAAVTALSACAAPQTAGHYANRDARMLHQVYLGVITDVREVVIDGASTGQGAAAGGLLGGLPGMQSGNSTRAAIGGVVGSLVGQGVEEAATKRRGLEMLVKLDQGASISVTQQADGLQYVAGQRVRVLVLNGAARVVHHREAPASRVPNTDADAAVPGS